jgi:hypothetical protein
LRKYIKVQQEVERIVSVQCNLCAHTMSPEEAQESLNVHQVGGYFSQFFGDMTVLEFDLCEQCLYEMVRKMRVPPIHKPLDITEDL